MKNTGASGEKVSSQEIASEQAKSRLSGKGVALIVLLCAIAMALTALAIDKNSGLSTIADNPNPMSSGENDEPYGIEGGDVYGEAYYYEEPCVGTSDVAYYAMEGGTLVFDPDDDASIGVDCIPSYIDENGNVVELPSASGSQFGSNAKKGLKEYKATVAVNPTVCYGSITAVPDPGYVFVSWNEGVNYSPKLYLWGAMSGTATAYFEKTPEPITAEPIDYEEPCVGSSKVKYYATEGGTLTFDPDDDASIRSEADSLKVYDESGNIIEMPYSFSPQFGPHAKTGLKEYVTDVAVNPTVCFGSITAVPDPGYAFVSWNNGENYSSKLYLWGAMSGTATAYFEKIPNFKEEPDPSYSSISINEGELHNDGEQEVGYFATEGGTLTYDPDDDFDVDDPSQNQLPSNPNAQTGLKEYKRKVAVTPSARYGSITAVPDSGYIFAGWGNGSKSSKLYVTGEMCGTATAYFVKDPVAGENKNITKDSLVVAAPTMSVYAQNALDGKVTLAQGKSTSLKGFAVINEIDYTGTITGKVKYESSNANIATVDASGKVIASKKKTGTAKITVLSIDNPKCKKVVTVKVVKKAKCKAVKAIKKLNLKKQYKASAKKQIAVKVTSWNPKAPSNKNFVVSVSPTSKASVDPTTNKVTFKAKGTVKVTVKSVENPKAKITVKVKVN